MPTMKEFTIRLDDRLNAWTNSARRRRCKKLTFSHSIIPFEEMAKLRRFVLDNPAAAKNGSDGRRAEYTETEVAQVRLHRPASWRVPRRGSASGKQH